MLDPWADAFRHAFIGAAVRAAATAPPEGELAVSVCHDDLRITVADAELARVLLPALGHLPAAVGIPAVELIAWTSSAAGIDPPSFPWTDADIGRRGGVRGLLEGPVRSAAAHDRTSLVLWDADRRIAACWWRDAGCVPPWDAGAPFRVALHFALRRPTRMLIHAASVGTNGVGVLLAGPGGSGKSTTTAACLATGLEILGDDYVALDAAASPPRAHTLYRTLRTTPSLHGRRADPADDGRRTLLIGDDLPGRMVQSLALAAVLVPRVTPAAESRVMPIARAEALRALAPSTLLQVPREPAAGFAPMSDLVAGVPCFALLLGRDRGVPAIVACLDALTP